MIAISAVLVSSGKPESGGLEVTVSEGVEDETEFEETLDTRLTQEEFKTLQPAELQPLPVDLLPMQTSQSMTRELNEELRETFEATLPEGGVPSELGTPGNNKVTRGSFTVWTDPADPEPLQPYYIWIEMQVPSDTRRLRVADLSGSVAGTDGYHAIIPTGEGYFEFGRGRREPADPARIEAFRPSRNDFRNIENGRGVLEVEEGTAKLRVMVLPPADDRRTAVRDRIHIRSRLLKEEQTLEIEF